MADRLQELIHDAIRNAAIKPPVPTSDESADNLRYAIELFNAYAERIEAKFGKGYFPNRMEHASAVSFRFNAPPTRLGKPQRWPETGPGISHAIVLLTHLSASDPVYQWMLNLILMLRLPAGKIEHEATARDGIWNRKLRKTVASMAARQAVQRHEFFLDRIEAEGRERTTAFHQRVLKAHAELARAIRADTSAEAKDVTAGEPWVPRDLRSSFKLVDDIAPIRETALSQEAEGRAEPLRTVFNELHGLSNKEAAQKLNAQGIKTPNGGKWYPAQVGRVRKRLARTLLKKG